MTEQELEVELSRLGLKIPQNEREEIAKAVKFIDQMAALVKKPRSVMVEPAHIVSFPKD